MCSTAIFCRGGNYKFKSLSKKRKKKSILIKKVGVIYGRICKNGQNSLATEPLQGPSINEVRLGSHRICHSHRVLYQRSTRLSVSIRSHETSCWDETLSLVRPKFWVSVSVSVSKNLIFQSQSQSRSRVFKIPGLSLSLGINLLVLVSVSSFSLVSWDSWDQTCLVMCSYTIILLICYDDSNW